jgi:hypothetical protein
MLFRNVVDGFNRQIGDAATGVQDSFLDKGPGRTRLETGSAGSAPLTCRHRGRFQIEIDEEFPEKKVAPRSWSDPQSVLANERETSPHSKVTFEKGRRIHASASEEGGPREFAQRVRESQQLVLDDQVVIRALSIACYRVGSFVWTLIPTWSEGFGGVGERHHDRTASLLEKTRRATR